MDISLTYGAIFIFISSIAAVSCSSRPIISETPSFDSSEALPIGYSQSKWIAEKICATAHKKCSDSQLDLKQFKPRISIIRVGQLCGDKNGLWNANEAYPLLLSTSQLINCLPNLENEVLNWLLVDKAAKAVLEIVMGGSNTVTGMGHKYSATMSPVYHVLNPHRTLSGMKCFNGSAKRTACLISK